MKFVLNSVFVLLLVSFGILRAQKLPPGVDDPQLWQKALRIHQSAIVLDTHVDVTMRIFHENFDIGKRHSDGHFDLPRAREGGLDGLFFSIFVPNRMDTLHPAHYALELIDAVYNAVARYPDQIEMAFTSEDVRRIHREGKIAALMGMENGSPIEHSLGLLRDFYRLGVRYITLTHSKPNDISDSATDTARWGGLSDFGKQVVREMNRLGMLVDVSHLSDDAIRDVLSISQTPVIASHSSVRALAHHPRNLPDELIKGIARNGGVIQINFYSGYLSDEYNQAYQKAKKELAPEIAALKEHFADDENAYWRAYIKLFERYHIPVPDASVIVDHIDYVVNLVGIDHVGLGSDFDGVSSLPKRMDDVSRLPLITYIMLKRGYSEEEIRKVLGGNLLRVMEANERFSRQQKSR